MGTTGHTPYPRAIVDIRFGGKNNSRGLTWRNQEFLRRYLTEKPRSREGRSRTGRRARTSERWLSYLRRWTFVSMGPARGTFALTTSECFTACWLRAHWAPASPTWMAGGSANSSTRCLRASSVAILKSTCDRRSEEHTSELQ